MENRILVTYASKGQSTAEVAAYMGQIIAQHDLPVDVLPVHRVSSLEPYAAVILGSAVRMGSVLPEARKFVEQHQGALRHKPFHVFVLCVTLSIDNDETRTTANACLEPLCALVPPASQGLFAGVVDPGRVGPLDRLIIKAVKAPLGDFRRWDEIGAWTEEALQKSLAVAQG
ncbi:MAG: flavodoxin [Chloroflexi bacterium]|jgi:menaquinone-dependent protoporphyrinogen oxidase|nr:flavodoxin domain-containing protein [Anaerolineaceae bacterium]NMB87880.1 flavodoxin [Chloroflexota bacterium]